MHHECQAVLHGIIQPLIQQCNKKKRKEAAKCVATWEERERTSYTEKHGTTETARDSDTDRAVARGKWKTDNLMSQRDKKTRDTEIQRANEIERQ